MRCCSRWRGVHHTCVFEVHTIGTPRCLGCSAHVHMTADCHPSQQYANHHFFISWSSCHWCSHMQRFAATSSAHTFCRLQLDQQPRLTTFGSCVVVCMVPPPLLPHCGSHLAQCASHLLACGQSDGSLGCCLWLACGSVLFDAASGVALMALLCTCPSQIGWLRAA